MVEQMNKSELSASSLIQSSADEVENDKQQEYILDKQYLRTNVIDVFDKETSMTCEYLRCHHKFSEHANVNVNIHVIALLERTFY